MAMNWAQVRDGPLEKLWEGKEGEGKEGQGIFEPQEFFFFNVSREWIFFFVKMLCTNIFFPWSNTKLKTY